MKNLKQSVSAALLLLSLISGRPVSAQTSQSFGEGVTVINAGIGFLGSISYYSGSGVTRTPVFALSGEYGVARLGPGTVGVGLAFGYQSASYTYHYDPYYNKDKWTTTVFGIRGTYHPDFLNSDKYDVYGAIQLTFDHFNYSFTSNNPYYNRDLYGDRSLGSYVRPYLIIGGRYYFNSTVGVFAELGYDISYLKLGLALKFGNAAPTKNN